MALKLEDKKSIVTEVAEVASKAIFAIAADYRGLTVSQVTALRAKARQTGGIYLRVVPNTLACRAVEGTDFAALQDVLVGPILLLFTTVDAGDAARLIRDFAKDNKPFQVKGLVLNGKLLAANQLEAIAKLPTRDEALALLLSVMKAPITKFVRTLAEPYAQAVRVVAAIRDQKQAA